MTNISNSRAGDDLVLVGWVKWSGDEFFAFQYAAAGDPLREPDWVPVYAKREDVPGV